MDYHREDYYVGGMLSQKLIIAVKLADKRQYRLAIEAGFCPSALSQMLHGARSVRPGDPRMIRLGKILGLKHDEIFEDQGEKL